MTIDSKCREAHLALASQIETPCERGQFLFAAVDVMCIIYRVVAKVNQGYLSREGMARDLLGELGGLICEGGVLALCADLYHSNSWRNFVHANRDPGRAGQEKEDAITVRQAIPLIRHQLEKSSDLHFSLLLRGFSGEEGRTPPNKVEAAGNLLLRRQGSPGFEKCSALDGFASVGTPEADFCAPSLAMAAIASPDFFMRLGIWDPPDGDVGCFSVDGDLHFMSLASLLARPSASEMCVGMLPSRGPLLLAERKVYRLGDMRRLIEERYRMGVECYLALAAASGNDYCPKIHFCKFDRMLEVSRHLDSIVEFGQLPERFAFPLCEMDEIQFWDDPEMRKTRGPVVNVENLAIHLALCLGLIPEECRGCESGVSLPCPGPEDGEGGGGTGKRRGAPKRITWHQLCTTALCAQACLLYFFTEAIPSLPSIHPDSVVQLGSRGITFLSGYDLTKMVFASENPCSGTPQGDLLLKKFNKESIPKPILTSLVSAFGFNKKKKR